MGELLDFFKGKLIKGDDTKKSTYQLLNEQRVNKDGQKYKLFDAEHDREKSLGVFASCLDSMRKEIRFMSSNDNREAVDDHFEKTIQSISAIRVDQKDRHMMPMKLIFDEFTKVGTINFDDKRKDGVTRSVADDGIMMLIPELQEEINENEANRTDNINARHTLVHEMLHAMSNRKVVKDGRQIYQSGMQLYGNDNIFDDINEGLNEYYTVMILEKMYPNAEIENRYEARKNVVDGFMQNLSAETQGKIFEAYVSGNFDQVISKYFTKMKTSTGESLLDRLELLRQNGYRVSESNSPENMKNAQLLVDGFKDFKQQSSSSEKSN